MGSTAYLQLHNRTNLSGQLIICGNGTVDYGEVCDDGNTDENDGCDQNCTEEYDFNCTGEPSVCTSTCGNGSKASNEACDDNNLTNNDGCSNICTIEAGYSCNAGSPTVCYKCGNGIKENTEACDDGNSNSGDGCSASCSIEPAYSCTGQPSICTSTCGNGTINSGETCDDSNKISGDGCNSNCSKESGYICSGAPSTCINNCGNGQLNFGEECDNGVLNSNSTPDACRTNCKNPRCGDGGKDTGEQCDDGNLVDNDGCSSTCTTEAAVCGNGFTDITEECDEGIFNSDTEPNTCRTNCTNPKCGDGVIDTGEQCDDGNTNNNDNCLNSCITYSCGDGYIHQNYESCEPPNQVNLCSSVCGPWITSGGGNGNSSSSSSNSTVIYTKPKKTPTYGCGNYIFEPDLGEECDKGNQNGSSDCSIECTLLKCGDGVVSASIGEECEPIPFANTNGSVYYQLPACGSFCVPPNEVGFTADEYCKYKEITVCTNVVEQDFLADYCGNGVQETGEECDAGGVCNGGTYDKTLWVTKEGALACFKGGGVPVGTDGDGCSSKCSLEICGDGKVQTRGKDGVLGTSDDELCDNGKVCQNTGEACLKDADCTNNQVCVYNIFADEACNARCKIDECQYSYELDLPALDPATHRLRLTVTDERGVSAVDTAFFSIGDVLTVAPEPATNVTATLLAQAFTNASDLKTQLTTDLTHYLTEKDTKAVLSCTVFDKQGNRVCNLPASAFKLELDGLLVKEAVFKEVETGFCGDGVRQINEECDDGNSNQDDDCSNQCVSQKVIVAENTGISLDDNFVSVPTQVCPNGIIEAPEECDDNNSVNGDGCDISCLIEKEVRCGDGIRQVGEQCDDGNSINGDGCSNICKIEDIEIDTLIACGDGIKDALEECDNGKKNGTAPDACRNSCKLAICGDGIKDSLEECDSGANNSFKPNACRPTCLRAECGDGIIDIGEECDGGDACSSICTILAQSICGNGKKEAQEQCDDGNIFGGDGCSSRCSTELFTPITTCGNSIIEGSEQCDDGNTIDTDACSNKCTRTSKLSLETVNNKSTVQFAAQLYPAAVAPAFTQVPLALLQPIASPVYQVVKTGPGMATLLAASFSAGIGIVRRKRRK